MQKKSKNSVVFGTKTILKKGIINLRTSKNKACKKGVDDMDRGG